MFNLGDERLLAFFQLFKLRSFFILLRLLLTLPLFRCGCCFAAIYLCVDLISILEMDPSRLFGTFFSGSFRSKFADLVGLGTPLLLPAGPP